MKGHWLEPGRTAEDTALHQLTAVYSLQLQQHHSKNHNNNNYNYKN